MQPGARRLALRDDHEPHLARPTMRRGSRGRAARGSGDPPDRGSSRAACRFRRCELCLPLHLHQADALVQVGADRRHGEDPSSTRTRRKTGARREAHRRSAAPQALMAPAGEVAVAGALIRRRRPRGDRPANSERPAKGAARRAPPRSAAAGCTSRRDRRGGRAGLDLAGVRRDGEVGDRRVLGLAASGGDITTRSRCALRERRSRRASR